MVTVLSVESMLAIRWCHEGFAARMGIVFVELGKKTAVVIPFLIGENATAC